jgi:hypothetical protein
MLPILLAFAFLGLAMHMAGSAGDRDNYSGDSSYTAPTGGVTKGKIYLISGTYVVARETVAVGLPFIGGTGVIRATKAAATGKSFVIGEKVYALANVVNKTATGAVLIGVAREAAGATDTSILIDTGNGLAPTAT